MEEIIEIKKHWEDRAKVNQNAVTGTTNDIYLRELEIKTFVKYLNSLGIRKNSKVLDVGCGDGYTTLNIVKYITDAHFIGIDYSANMIKNANENLKNYPSLAENVSFKVGVAINIFDLFDLNEFDFILSDRCLINLGTSKNQYEAIEEISSLVKKGGYYLAIENFIEGQNNLTIARKHMRLSDIEVRWHNYS